MRASLPIAVITIACAAAVALAQQAGTAGPLALPYSAAPTSPSALDVSTARIDLATGAHADLSVRTTDGTPLAFAARTTAPWLTVFPAAGVAAASPVQLQVSVNRSQMLVGSDAARFVIRDARGAETNVLITAIKRPTAPRLVPWVEANIADDAQIQYVADGLRVWRYVTDTAVVSTGPGKAELFSRLRAAVPGSRLIPGLKTSPRLVPLGADSLLGWQLVALDIDELIAATGENHVLLENETAFEAYLVHGARLDLGRLREALAALPPNVDLYWYPGVSVQGDAQVRQRSRELTAVVAGAVRCRFVDLSYADPSWREWPPSILARQEIARLSNRVPVPLLYVGVIGDWQYWDEVDIRTALRDLRDYPAALVYPGLARWIESAEALKAVLADYDPNPPQVTLTGTGHLASALPTVLPAWPHIGP